MFTGLVQDLGTVTARDDTGGGMRLRVATALAGEIGEGDSVAVNGVCLTARAIEDGAFAADVVPETLQRTSLGADTVNLELALRAGDRLGGHIMQGHVDATATVRAVEPEGFGSRITIEAEPELLRYVVAKGSIAVNGVSLTVADVDDHSFAIALIPETLQRTTLGEATPGDTVNLEVDVVAKYVEKLCRR